MPSRHNQIAVLVGVAVVLTAEWLRAPATWLAVAGLVAGVLAFGFALRSKGLAGTVAAILAALAAASALGGSLTLSGIDTNWPSVRGDRLLAASERLDRILSEALEEARTLVDRGAKAQGMSRPGAFRLLESLTRDASYEAGVVLFGEDGRAWAWGGRHRETPSPVGPPEVTRFLTLYTVLEARSETVDGWNVAQVVLDADTIIAGDAQSLSARFRAETGFSLRFYDPGTAPVSSNVFDFGFENESSTDLLSVELVPPTRGQAAAADRAGASKRVATLLVAMLLALAIFGPSGRWRMTTLGLTIWAAARGSIGPALGVTEPFASESFFRPTLGVLSSSAGILALVGAALCMTAIVLWSAELRRRAWSWPAALLLVLGTPYALRELGRGINVPAREISVSLWLTWELTLALVAAAILLTAAALVRSSEIPRRAPARVYVGVAWAIAAAVAGLWLWEPSGTWPEWYEFIWLPAAVLVVGPTPRRSMIMAVAIVAGTAATLITWEATVRGRMTLAETDVDHLRLSEDPDAYAILNRAASAIQAGFPVERGADLYRLWRRAVGNSEDYPARLWVVDPAGALQAELPLSDLGDFRLSTVRATILDRQLASEPEIVLQPRGPGAYYLLIAPLADGNILAIGVGPRSESLSGGVLGPFLRGERAFDPSYSLEVRPTPVEELVTSDALGWAREGWHLHGDVTLPSIRAGRGPPGRLHADVDLSPPISLLVRGALMVLLNVVVLSALWLIVMAGTGELPQGLRQTTNQVVGSYRARLTLALSAFFILPALAFTIWSIGRLGNEALAARDLVIRRTLRDAWEAGNLVTVLEESDPSAASHQLEEVAKRVEAELFLYGGEELFTGSAPILADLGLVEPYLPPTTFQSLILDDAIESAEEITVGGRPSRMGYRRVTSESPVAILAAVRLFDAPGLQGGQRDLAFVLLLGTVAGLAGSAWLAGLAGQQLARPVAALRDAAVAVGRGEAPDLPTEAPTEFRAVMEAFSTMASDVQRSHEMLEAARRRTARVLQNVATGVVAVDKHLIIAMANPRAAQIIGESLEPGTQLDETDAKWHSLWDSVRRFLEPGEHRQEVAAPEEFEIDNRRVRMQLARLRGGAVVALDDTTELAEAERVLAWGEMARQIAHEIKNPLTPLRLGLQHLERVYEQSPEQFGSVFADTSARLQAEIARLDAIARAFSRFGAPHGGAESEPLEDVSLDECVAEVLALYQLGDDDVAYQMEGSDAGVVQARRDEAKEVLINLVENARNADAGAVTFLLSPATVQVRDDGCGIPGDILPRIFEPRFSTKTSGAGLGLAIVKRLVESWGARIDVASAQGIGTTFTVRWDGERAASIQP